MSCLISSSVISPATGDASGKRTTMSTSWDQCIQHNFVIVEGGEKGNGNYMYTKSKIAIPGDCDSLHHI